LYLFNLVCCCCWWWYAAGGGGGSGKDLKKETQLGLSTKKGDDFPRWYSELVVSSELISYYDVSGECCDCCLVLQVCRT
jgi:hypothetical protein